MFSRKTLFTIIVLLTLSVGLASAQEVPPLTGRVVDLAGLLTPSEEQRLSMKLAQFERITSNQIAILTIPSLGDENLEEYSIRVVEEWKLGQEGKDNGVLILVAKAERQVRIEVGYGLEGSLTDLKSFYIIRQIITPAFKRGDYFGGLSAAIDAIIRVTKGEYVVEKKSQGRGQNGSGLYSLLHLLFLFFLLPLLGFGRRRGWFWAGMGTGYWMGSFGRRSSGGGFGGFGGFSGGGGGFGGGGASGGW